MDHNFMDELFSRINQLEEEKKLLAAELQAVNAEIDENAIKELLPDIDEDRDKTLLDDIITKSNMLSSKISTRKNGNIVEMQITYIPLDNFPEVYIAGDFTNWEMVEMKNDSGMFNYMALLMKGYQYFFCFYYNGQMMIDFNLESTENPGKNGQTNNIITVPNDDGICATFDVKKDYPLLQESIKKEKVIAIQDGDENALLESVISFSNFLSKNLESLKLLREEKLAEVKFEYDEKIIKLQEIIQSKFSNLNEIFVSRVIQIGNTMLLIKEIQMKECVIKCVRLYDKNGIKVNVDLHIQNGIYEELAIQKIFDNTYIYLKEESENILQMHKDNDRSILKIYYQLLGAKEGRDNVIDNDIEENEGDLNPYMRIQPLRETQRELIPYKIIPETVDINQYHIEIQDNQITQVRHRDTGSIIFFEAILIRDDTSSQLTGLISTSMVKVYTSLYSKDILNILHVHLNDTSPEITVDSIFLEKEESVSDFKNFNVDSIGKKLNYRFLFRNYKLIKVLYSVSNNFVDEPPFEEIRLNSTAIVRIKNGEFKDFYGKISNIPIGMLARKDKELTDLEPMRSSGGVRKDACSDRHLEELPGLVSMKVLFTPSPEIQLIEKPTKISLPVCFLIPLTPKEEVEFERKLAKGLLEKQTMQITMLNTLYDEFLKYNEYVKNQNLLTNMSLDELKDLVEKVESKVKKEDILPYLEESEDYQVKF